MFEGPRQIAEHYSGRAATVFSALSGMMAAALVVGDPHAGPTEPIEYLYAGIMFAVTVGLGLLTIWAAKGQTLRWTIAEMAASFGIGVVAMVVIARNL